MQTMHHHVSVSQNVCLKIQSKPVLLKATNMSVEVQLFKDSKTYFDHSISSIQGVPRKRKIDLEKYTFKLVEFQQLRTYSMYYKFATSGSNMQMIHVSADCTVHQLDLDREISMRDIEAYRSCDRVVIPQEQGIYIMSLTVKDFFSNYIKLYYTKACKNVSDEFEILWKKDLDHTGKLFHFHRNRVQNVTLYFNRRNTKDTNVSNCSIVIKVKRNKSFMRNCYIKAMILHKVVFLSLLKMRYDCSYVKTITNIVVNTTVAIAYTKCTSLEHLIVLSPLRLSAIQENRPVMS